MGLTSINVIRRAYRNKPDPSICKLFAELDAGEAYLRAVGRNGWRAGLLHNRATVLQALGRPEEAVPCAEEAVALKERNPDAPGYTLATYRWSLGDLLLELGRHAEAAQQYEAVLADPGSDPYDRLPAQAGLGQCALADGNPATARRHAEQAVQLAEGMGDDSLCPSLELHLDACLAAPDLTAACKAAERYLTTAHRTGSNLRLYFALRDAAKVALAEAEAEPARRAELLEQARAQLDEAEPIARLMDRSAGRDRSAREIAGHRKKLAELEGGDGEEKSE
jgi:tetratricopeptide (TPR) repeat protein